MNTTMNFIDISEHPVDHPVHKVVIDKPGFIKVREVLEGFEGVYVLHYLIPDPGNKLKQKRDDCCLNCQCRK